MNKLNCLRCGHYWLPRIEVVKMCPRCKSRLWNISPSQRIIQYAGKYGKLIINLDTQKIDDQLDREHIWADAHEDYAQQIIYSQILDEAGIAPYAPPKSKSQFWNGTETDLGFKAILKDGTELIVDAEGVFFC